MVTKFDWVGANFRTEGRNLIHSSCQRVWLLCPFSRLEVFDHIIINELRQVYTAFSIQHVSFPLQLIISNGVYSLNIPYLVQEIQVLWVGEAFC